MTPEASPPPDSWTHDGLPQRLVFGAGRVAELAEAVASLGAGRAVLVTTAGRATSPDGARVAAALGPSRVATFDGVTPHVPRPVVDALVARAGERGADVLVSLGGGSCADAAKAAAHRLADEGGGAAVAHVAVPTTYSGAEVTPFYGVTDPATGTKSGGVRADLAPRVVVYDPELTLTTPTRVTAETALNALAHCVEALWARDRTPEAAALAAAGATTLAEALPEVVDHPEDLAARARLLAGAAQAGRALQNAAMGVHHGLAQQVGARTGIAHGLANAVLLPHSIRFNAEGCPGALAVLARAWGTDDPAGFVAGLLGRVGLPSRLSEVGVTGADVEAVARAAPTNRNVARNPVPVDEAGALRLLAAAL